MPFSFRTFLRRRDNTNKKTKEEELCEMALKERYVQGMVLSGVGDALGYKNGEWEFCHSGLVIFTELQKLGGLEKVNVKKPGWMVSDDTVMHLATGEALVDPSCQTDREKLFLKMAQCYKLCMHDMSGRAPGNTCMSIIHYLKPLVPKGYRVPFNPRGGGCGASMRAMCIGLRYPRPEQLEELIAVSVEAGRMSHHHPTGYLGSLAAALFTSYCVQGVNVNSWGKGLLDSLPLALKYVESTGHCVKENKEAWGYFKGKWEDYLKLRGLEDGVSEPIFPEKFDFAERDKFYKSVSFSGWGGSSGHDAPLIAYDAFLGARGVWSELCNRALFHGGDSDSTGVMAACWYGVTWGWDQVPHKNYKNLEYRDRLEKIGAKLYDLAYPDGDAQSSQNDEMVKCDPSHDVVIDEERGETTQNEGKDEVTESEMKGEMKLDEVKDETKKDEVLDEIAQGDSDVKSEADKGQAEGEMTQAESNLQTATDIPKKIKLTTADEDELTTSDDGTSRDDIVSVEQVILKEKEGN